jgi:phosphate-selective porin OprO/OprP
MSRFFKLLSVAVVVVALPLAAIAEVGYDEGFWMKSSDANKMLKVGGYLQADLDYNILDVGKNTLGFGIPHAQFWFEGFAPNPNWKYRIQGELNSGAFVLADAYAEYASCDMHNLRAGQFKVPFGRQAYAYSNELAFIDRSRATNFFGSANLANVRDLGLMYHGKYDFLSYYAAVVNGAGANNANAPDQEFSYALRFVLGDNEYAEADLARHDELAWGVGLSYYMNEYNQSPATFALTGADPSFGTNLRSHLAGADFVLRSNGFAFQGEFFYAHRNPMGLPTGGATLLPSVKQYGGYAQLNYLLQDNMDVGVRGSYIDPDKDTGDDQYLDLDAVAGYYFDSNHRYKLQGQYGYHRQNAGNLDDHSFTVMLQASI